MNPNPQTSDSNGVIPEKKNGFDINKRSSKASKIPTNVVDLDDDSEPAVKPTQRNGNQPIPPQKFNPNEVKNQPVRSNASL